MDVSGIITFHSLLIRSTNCHKIGYAPRRREKSAYGYDNRGIVPLFVFVTSIQHFQEILLVGNNVFLDVRLITRK